MANNRSSVEVILGFKANTDQAQKAIRELNKSLDAIQSKNIENLGLNTELRQAAEAAKLVQTNLQAALNVNTGKIDVSQFSKGLKEANVTINELGQRLAGAGQTGQQAFLNLSRSIALMDAPLKQTNATLNNMLTTLKNTVKWELSSNLVHGIESAFSSAISYAKNLNASLTDIRIVSGQSVDQMAKFAVEANNAAKALGTTTKSYADAALIYYQQGDSAELAAKKAEITLKATNAAFSATAEEMSQLLTATWNSYQAGTDELEHMVDVMANLGAHTATSLEEIATALQKVAATANTVGVSMEQMSAMISTVSSATRLAPTVVGTAMNTIMSRMGGLKLGETLEDGVDLNKYSAALKKVGVDVLDATGNLRDMGTVVEELGKKWQTLSKGQQSAVAQTIGGTRQYTTMMALFSNWDKYQENLDLAKNSDGALNKMQQTYMESWEAASKRMKASLETIYGDLINDQGMIKLLNNLTKVIDQVENLIKTFGGLPGILTQIGMIATQVFSNNIASSLIKTTTSIQSWFNSFKNLSFDKSQTGFQFQGNNKFTNWVNPKLQTLSHQTQALGMTQQQREFNQVSNDTWKTLEQTRSESSSNIYDVQAESAQILLEKKQQLIAIESNLTEEQKRQYQVAIANLEAQNKELDRLVENYREQEQAAKDTKRDNFTSYSARERAQGRSEYETEEAWQAEVKHKIDVLNSTDIFKNGFIDTTNAVKDLSGLIDKFNEYNATLQKTETLHTIISKAISNYEEGDMVKFTSDINQVIKVFESAEFKGSKFEDIGTKIKELSESSPTEAVAVLNELDQTLTRLENGGEANVTTLTHALKNLGYTDEEITNLVSDTEKLTDLLMAMRNSKSNIDDLGNSIQIGFSKAQKYTSQAISAFAGAVRSFSAWSHVTANWDSASLVSKLTSVANAAQSTMSTVASLAKVGSAFGPYGTLIGAGVGLAVSALGAISGKSEADQKYLEKQAANFYEGYQKRKTNLNSENTEIQNLLESYTSLREEYKTNLDVQADLIESTNKLAEAYGIVGVTIRATKDDLDNFDKRLLIQQLEEKKANAKSTLNSAQSGLKQQVNSDKKTKLRSNASFLEGISNIDFNGQEFFANLNQYNSDNRDNAIPIEQLMSYVTGHIIKEQGLRPKEAAQLEEDFENAIKNQTNYEEFKSRHNVNNLDQIISDQYNALQQDIGYVSWNSNLSNLGYLSSWRDDLILPEDQKLLFSDSGYLKELSEFNSQEEQAKAIFAYQRLSDKLGTIDTTGFDKDQLKSYNAFVSDLQTYTTDTYLQYARDILDSLQVEQLFDNETITKLSNFDENTKFESIAKSYEDTIKLIDENRSLFTETLGDLTPEDGEKYWSKVRKIAESVHSTNSHIKNQMELVETIGSMFGIEGEAFSLQDPTIKLLTNWIDNEGFSSIEDINPYLDYLLSIYNLNKKLSGTDLSYATEYGNLAIKSSEAIKSYNRYKEGSSKVKSNMTYEDYEDLVHSYEGTDFKLSEFTSKTSLQEQRAYLKSLDQANAQDIADKKRAEIEAREREQANLVEKMERTHNDRLRITYKERYDLLQQEIDKLKEEEEIWTNIAQTTDSVVQSYSNMNKILSGDLTDEETLTKVSGELGLSVDQLSNRQLVAQQILSTIKPPELEENATDAQKAAYNERLKAYNELREQAVNIINEPEIEKIDRAQNAISALQSDLQKLANGEGLSRKTKSLLELAGIKDPVTDMASARKALNQLTENIKQAQQKLIDNTIKDTTIDVSILTQDDIEDLREKASKGDAEAQRILEAYDRYIQYQIQLAENAENYMKTYAIEIEKAAEIISAKTEEINKKIQKLQSVSSFLYGSLETGELSKEQVVQLKNINEEYLTMWQNAGDAYSRMQVIQQINNEIIDQQHELLGGIIARNSTAQDRITRKFLGVSKGDAESGGRLSQLAQSKFTQADYDNFISDTGMSEAARSALQKAVENVKIRVGNNFSWLDVYNELDKLTDEAEDNVDEVIAKILNEAENGYKSIADKENQLAQNAIDVWKNAFQEIANFRKSILEKEDISSYLTDPKMLVKLALASGQLPSQILNNYQSGKLEAKDFKLANLDIETISEQMGLGLLGKTKVTDGNKILSTDLIQRYINEQSTDDHKITTDEAKEYLTSKLNNLLEAVFPDENERMQQIEDYLNGSADIADDIFNILQIWLDALPTSEEATNKFQQYGEAEATLNTAKDQYGKVIEQEEGFSEATHAIRTGATLETALQDQDRDLFLSQVQDILKDESISLEDMLDWDALDDRWDTLSQGFQDKVMEARGEIYKAAVEFREIVTGTDAESGQLGFEEGSEEYKKAQQEVTDATISNADAMANSVTANQEVEQSLLDDAETRQGAISKALSARTTEERASAADALRDAYAGANKELREHAEIMAKEVEQGKDLSKSNKLLTSQNVKLGKGYVLMTKEQKNQYKQMLKNNKVTVEGYKTLDEYFAVLDQSEKIYDEGIKNGKKFARELEKAGKDTVEGYQDQFKKLPEEMKDAIGVDLFKDILPDEFDNIASQLWDLATKFDGDYGTLVANLVRDAVAKGEEGLGQETMALLEQMGFSKDKVIEKQEEIKAAILANGDWGQAEFLSFAADMDVDPTQFDAVITVLNQALLIIKQIIESMGIEYDFPWQIVPTLSELGVGKGSGGSGGGGGKGGGGGGKDKKKKVEHYAQPKDEKERYHEIRDELEQQQHLLEKIDKLKDRTFGKHHLDQINAEIKALEQDLKLQEQYFREAQKYYEANLQKLVNAGAKFNKDGTINYEEFMDKIIAEYNAAVDAFNWSEQTALDEMRLERAKAEFEDMKKLLEEYEEDLDLIDEIQGQIIEEQTKISAAALEGIQYKIEIKLDLSDRDIAILEYFNNKWEELLERQDNRMLNMTKQVTIYETNLTALGIAMRELQAKYNEGVLTEADYAEGMKDINDKILEQLENIQDVKDSLKELYGDTLSLASDKLEKYTDLMEHSRDVMEDYIAMSELMGRGADYASLEEVYQMQYESSISNIEAAKMYLDTLKASRDEIERQVAENGWTEVLQQQWYDVSEAITEGENDLLDKTQQALEDAQSMFENTMQKIIASFDDVLFNMKNGLSQLEDDYNYYNEQQERYLSTSKELYEVAKLNRQIDNSIQDATTKTSKERLKALQEVINKQSESTRLTEYDVKMLELQYKHALALQALEEAKNAKSTVRLTRDENGNYGYQYTADDDQINDARQQVDDALQEINELAANRAAEIEQQVIETERQYRDELLAIAQDTTLTLEERQAKMEELTRRHNETLQFYNEQYTNATNALITNQEYVYQRYGVTILENTGMIQDQMNATVKAMIDKTSDYATYLEEQMAPGGQIYEALAKYKRDMGIVEDASGLSWSDMTGSIEDYQKANDDAKQSIAEVNDVLQQTLAGVADVTEQWDKHIKSLEAVIDLYEKLGQSTADAVARVADVEGLYGTSIGGMAGINSQAGVSGLTTKQQWQYTWGPSNGLFGVHSAYDSEAAALAGAKEDIQAQFQNLIHEGEDDAETEQVRRQAEAWMKEAMKTIKVTSYLSGGLADYTGPAWLDGSKSSPELVLNSRDTTNILSAVDIVRALDEETLRQMTNMMHYSAVSALMGVGSGLGSAGVNPFAQTLDQNVHITADFPNVTDKNEIIEAFDDLVNLASQYAGRG